MSVRQLAVVSAGLVTSVGLNTATTCAALRCRLNNFIETGFTDQEDEAVIGAPVPWPDGGIRLEKLVEMAASAIRQALDSANLALQQLPGIPLMLCLAETERAGRMQDLDNALFDGLEQQFGHAFHADSGILASGQVGVVFAMNHARHLLYDKHHATVLVVAVDSLLNRATVVANLEQERLLATDIRAGFIPGEAAGALVVTRPNAQIDVQLLIFGLGAAEEKALPQNDIPLLGKGLAAAIKAALKEADAEAEEIDCCIASVSGEDYYFEELALAQQRAGIAAHLWLPAESLGETGSVVGCIQLAWWLEARRKFYIPGNAALLLASADNGRRTAMAVAFQYSQAYRAQAFRPPGQNPSEGAQHGA
jgi:3-oxoacyl-[acyl-carrier-protein] synthase-1